MAAGEQSCRGTVGDRGAVTEITVGGSIPLLGTNEIKPLAQPGWFHRGSAPGKQPSAKTP
jgi:hypothetical protein